MKEIKELSNQYFSFLSWEERIEAANLPFYDNPQTDNDRLINWQYQFLTSQLTDKKAEAEIWKGAYQMSINLIKREQKRNNLHFNSTDREIKAGIATDYVCRRYKIYLNNKNEIYVIRNFVYQLTKAVEHALYDPAENDLILEDAVSIEDKQIQTEAYSDRHEEESEMIRDKVKAYCQQQCVMDGAFRQVYDEQKLDDCVKMLFKKASKLKEGNCAMVEDMTVYKWVRDFFYGDDTPVEDTVMAAEIYTDSQEDEEDIKSEDLEVVKVEKPAQKKEKKQKSDWMEGQPTLFDF